MRVPLRILSLSFLACLLGGLGCSSSSTTTTSSSGTLTTTTTTAAPSICAGDPRVAPYALGLEAASADGSVWLFSSSEAIANLAAWLPGQDWQRARAVATHLRIAANARKLGFGVVCESRPVLASVVASIESMK